MYVAVNAIDERSSHGDFLQILRTLGTDRKLKRLQFVISSQHNYIEKFMPSFSVSISMNNSSVEQDIRHHVHSNLQSNPQFGGWPRDLLHEVEESITNGAGGMYVSLIPSYVYELRLFIVKPGFAGPCVRLTLFND